MSSSPPETTKPKETLCAKCGACVPVCPIFKATGRETLTARGRIHLLSKLTSPKVSSELNDIFSKCLLCGACQNACPRGIDIPSTIIAARSNKKLYDKDTLKKKIIRKILSKPIVLKSLASIVKLPKNPPVNFPKESGLNIRLAGLDISLQAPTNTFIDSQRTITQSDTSKKTVLYFTGCLANHLIPNIAESSVTLLKKLCAYDAITPASQGCCGMASLSAGDSKQAILLAKRNIQAFSTNTTINLPIFTSCSTCFSALRQYPELFESDTKWRHKAENFAMRVHEFSTFLTENRQSNKISQTNEPGTNNTKVFYHDPCHLRFGHPNGSAPYPAITTQPRELIEETIGEKPIELPDGPQCCGQGGLFHLSHKDISNKISLSLRTDFLKLDAQFTLTTCSGCLLQWKSSLEAVNSPAKCLHLAEFLALHTH